MIKLVKPGIYTFYLSDMCAEYSICPKQARRKLRERFGRLDENGEKRWAFHLNDKRAVLDIIRRRA